MVLKAKLAGERQRGNQWQVAIRGRAYGLTVAYLQFSWKAFATVTISCQRNCLEDLAGVGLLGPSRLSQCFPLVVAIMRLLAGNLMRCAKLQSYS
jgi:hypothetical protein